MNDMMRWLRRRIGRRNLPFLMAVVLLALIIVLLMIFSPSTDSSAERDRAVQVSGD